MNKNLLIIFVKNIKLGKVKTRLAKTIGNQKALLIYSKMVEEVEQMSKGLIVEKISIFRILS